SARGRSRSIEFSISLSLCPGRPGHGARQCREARALSADPRRRAQARRRPHLEPRRGSHCRVRRALPRPQGQDHRSLDIVNGALMKGMDEVGRLFNANELIVAEVLQSAEVMKAAVAFLEPHMDKADVATRGKVV